jgi:hypothetical protein
MSFDLIKIDKIAIYVSFIDWSENAGNQKVVTLRSFPFTFSSLQFSEFHNSLIFATQKKRPAAR